VAAYLHFPEARPENVQQRHGGRGELVGPGKALLGMSLSLSGDEARGDRGLGKSQPWPCAPSASTVRGEAESSSC
jgi:hypothetical protein